MRSDTGRGFDEESQRTESKTAGGEGAGVAAYWGSGGPPRDGHEAATLEVVAREVAQLLGRRYVGVVCDADSVSRADFLVPRDALLDDEARRLGARDATCILGGIVPHAFVASKVIAHPLIDAAAQAPVGWSSRFPEDVKADVLRGYAAFCMDDAREGARRLLAQGPVRLKAADGVGGRGQIVVRGIDDLEYALGRVDPTCVRECGLAIEQDLTNTSTFSVGQVVLGALCVSYVGTQRLTRDHAGHSVYGGSTLSMVRGGWEALLAHAPKGLLTRCIRKAVDFDVAAKRAYPGLRLTRSNYDLIAGTDAVGRECTAVLEQSWRIGGASPAELLGMKTLQRNDAAQCVRQQTTEVYADIEVPPDASVFYQGIDPRVGRLTKFCRVEAYGNVFLPLADCGR